MKNIDIVRELNSTLSASIREAVSGKLGFSANTVDHIVTRAAPVLVATLMAAGSTPHGARQVLAAVMAPESDARIAERLHERLATTAGLRELEVMGQTFARACLSASMGELGDCVAAHVGVPAQPASALTAVIAAVLGGLLKYHMLIEQAAPGDLTQLLANQWPFVEPWLTDGSATALRFDGAAEFRDAIPAQLRVLANSQQREPALAPARAQDLEGQPISTAALLDDRAGRSTVRWIVALAVLGTVAGVAAAVLVPIFRQDRPTMQPAVAPQVTVPARAASSLSSAPSVQPSTPARSDSHVATNDVASVAVELAHTAPPPTSAPAIAPVASAPAFAVRRRRPPSRRIPETICVGVAEEPSIRCTTFDDRSREGKRSHARAGLKIPRAITHPVNPVNVGQLGRWNG
jgi:hypothetical protein